MQQALIQEPAIEVLSDGTSHVTIFRYIPLRHIFKKLQSGKDLIEEQEDDVEVKEMVRDPEVSPEQEEKPDSEADPSQEPNPQKDKDAVNEEDEVKRKIKFDEFANEDPEEIASPSEAKPDSEAIIAPEVPEKRRKKKSNTQAIYSFLTRLFVNNVNKQIRNDINQTEAAALDLNIFLGQGKPIIDGANLPA